MRGAKPKPDSLKLLAGNPGKRDLQLDRKPRPDVAIPDMPKGMAGEAKKEWQRIVPLLEGVGCISRLDTWTLAAYCHWVAVFKDALEEVTREGVSIAGSKGSLRKHPAVSVMKDATESIRQFSALFGLSPADRSRIVFRPDEYEDLFDQFLNEKPQLEVVNNDK